MPRPAEPPLRLTRRGYLTFGLLGAGAVLGGAGLLTGPDHPVTMTPESRVDPVAVDRTALLTRTKVGAATFVYEVDQRPTAYYVTKAFAARLDRWLAVHAKETGQAVDAVTSYGAWTPGTGRSWHGSGEAFDVVRLRSRGKDLVSARYDEWRDAPAAELRRRLSAYWRLAAGLHTEFADVVTYLYDVDHSNHVHVDTGRFGPAGAPRLIERSRVQVQAVQAMLVHVWGRPGVRLSGDLDGPTRDAAARVIEDAGGVGEITDGVEAWRSFMLATLRHT